jgi:hypothetical protein
VEEMERKKRVEAWEHGRDGEDAADYSSHDIAFRAIVVASSTCHSQCRVATDAGGAAVGRERHNSRQHAVREQSQIHLLKWYFCGPFEFSPYVA